MNVLIFLQAPLGAFFTGYLIFLGIFFTIWLVYEIWYSNFSQFAKDLKEAEKAVKKLRNRWPHD
jgi:hypothetical protein